MAMIIVQGHVIASLTQNHVAYSTDPQGRGGSRARNIVHRVSLYSEPNGCGNFTQLKGRGTRTGGRPSFCKVKVLGHGSDYPPHITTLTGI
jgi:hypothetical protein